MPALRTAEIVKEVPGTVERTMIVLVESRAIEAWIFVNDEFILAAS